MLYGTWDYRCNRSTHIDWVFGSHLCHSGYIQHSALCVVVVVSKSVLKLQELIFIPQCPSKIIECIQEIEHTFIFKKFFEEKFMQ